MDQKNREQWYSKLFRMINSGVSFSLAYLLFTYFYWFFMALVGKIYRFDAFVYYYGIKFILNNHEWSAAKIAVVYSAPSIACLGLGLLCLYLHNKMSEMRSMLHLFLLWGYLIGTGIFASQGIIAVMGTNHYNTPYYENLSVVFSWLHLPSFAVYLFNIPLFILFVYFAVNAARPFLMLSYSYTKVNKVSRRRRYFLETAIVPFLMGAVITTANTFPMNLPIHIIYLGVIGTALVVGLLSLSYIEILKDDLIRFKSFQTLNFLWLFLLGIVSTFVFVTFRGIYFG